MIINKLLNIAKGWYYSLTGKHESLARKRKRICYTCEYREMLNKNVSICSICGCFIDAKVRVEDEKCKMNKW